MSLRSDLALYTDSMGFVANQPNPPVNCEGNLLLHTSAAYVTLAQNGPLSEDDRQAFARVVAQCEIASGVYVRSPGAPYRGDAESQDDIIGLCAAAKVLGLPDIAKRILEHGKANEWEMNGAHLNRFQAMIAAAYWGAGEQCPFTLRLETALSIVYGSWQGKTQQDPWILNWLLLMAAPKDCFMVNLARSFYLREIKKYWPAGLKSVFGTYFNDPDHFLARWSVGIN